MADGVAAADSGDARAAIGAGPPSIPKQQQQPEPVAAAADGRPDRQLQCQSGQLRYLPVQRHRGRGTRRLQRHAPPPPPPQGRRQHVRGEGAPLPHRPLHPRGTQTRRRHPPHPRRCLYVRSARYCLRRVLRARPRRHHREARHRGRRRRRDLHGRRRLGPGALHLHHRSLRLLRRRRHRHHRRLRGLQHPLCHRHVRHLLQDRAIAHLVAALPRLHLLQCQFVDTHLFLSR